MLGAPSQLLALWLPAQPQQPRGSSGRWSAAGAPKTSQGGCRSPSWRPGSLWGLCPQLAGALPAHTPHGMRPSFRCPPRPPAASTSWAASRAPSTSCAPRTPASAACSRRTGSSPAGPSAGSLQDTGGGGGGGAGWRLRCSDHRNSPSCPRPGCELQALFWVPGRTGTQDVICFRSPHPSQPPCAPGPSRPRPARGSLLPARHPDQASGLDWAQGEELVVLAPMPSETGASVRDAPGWACSGPTDAEAHPAPRVAWLSWASGGPGGRQTLQL